MNRILFTCLACMQVVYVHAQHIDSSFLQSLHWRNIGPHRGGRTVGAVGIPQQPNVFYIGVNNGGVWRTNDYGRTWKPIFDEQPTGSIGDIAIAPSNPAVIYVGSGEGLQRPDLSVGNGIYKSSDTGKTWTFLGLEKVQQVGGLAIDPKNEQHLYVAALGHPYGPNQERGIYRTLDGGITWEHVLYIDENTGAIQVTIDPNNPEIIFADLWAGRQAPWENGMWNGKGSGLYKSTDGGNHWRKITNGLPTTEQGLSRIGFCIAPSDSRRMYACIEAGNESGVYRSNDAGESWQRIQTDDRLWGRGIDFAEMKVDPKNPDIVYDANVVTWKSTDGGAHWSAWRGAPGGDDYHRLWINPLNPDIILLAGDQGAIITVNGGETFSSWYNQPTAQFYHVSTDNAFPYNVYSGQQESGSVGIASRGNDGSITFREWHPVGAEEYGYIAPDPLNPDIIYGGKLSRYDKRTGQAQDISPEVVRSGKYRFLRTAPVLFSPLDPHCLFYAGNVLFKTTDEGHHWDVISPDLTRERYHIPDAVGIYYEKKMDTMKRRGVIYTVAPSPVDIKTIWCGTDDGLIHLTTDGGNTWKDVTPPGVSDWSKISLMDAGHFDANTAYAAVNRIRCDDQRPHIYRTHDGGKHWTEIVQGLPDDPVNVVREDPVRKGLLFAGSERAVYVSFDDGDHWQSLRLNMPCTSIRDLVVKEDDLVVGTHGRSFWILDNISLLREIDAATQQSPMHFFAPGEAYRVRWNMNTDTPLPQEEPAGENPPDGAVMDYYLANDHSLVQLDVYDSLQHLVRSYRSDDTLYTIPKVNIPTYWIRPQQLLPASKGAHRFAWDLHHQPLNEAPRYPIAATYRNTAPEPSSPWVMPGYYSLVLTVDGSRLTQVVNVKMDPRVTVSMADLQEQYRLSMQAYEAKKACASLIASLDSCLRILKPQKDRSAVFRSKRHELATQMEGCLHQQGEGTPQDLHRLHGAFSTLLDRLQQSDSRPTEAMQTGLREAMQAFTLRRREADELLESCSQW